MIIFPWRPLPASLLLPMCLTAALALAQDSVAPQAAPSAAAEVDKTPQTKAEHAQADQEAPPDKRVLGVLPNYRTINETGTYSPITTKQKLTIASKDSFDYPLVGLAAFIAAYGQLDNANPSFGQGWAGYGRRVGTAYADQAIGNMLTEAIFPSLLHEDPRYF